MEEMISFRCNHIDSWKLFYFKIFRNHGTSHGTPWKGQKTFGFLVFLGGIEMEQP